MKKTLLCSACSILFGLASWAQVPKADVMDIVFNDDGTIVDASPMQNPVTIIGLPRIEKSTQFDMNVLCQSDEYWGRNTQNYVRIDRNEQLDAAIGDGITLETMVRPYFTGGQFDNKWVNIFGGFQGGGIGIIIYGGVYDFEANIDGGYRDAVNNFPPVANEWIHLMGVWNPNDGTMKLFINGELSGIIEGIEGSLQFGTNTFYALGTDYDTGNTYLTDATFAGDIALARMYNDPLSDEEVAAVYADLQSKRKDVAEHSEDPTLRYAEDGTVLISNTQELSDFGRTVRQGSTSLNARLEADIEYPGTEKMLSTNQGYNGEFDGQGHSISINMSSTTDDVALFKTITGASIHDLTIKGDIATSAKYAAAIAAHGTGSNTLNRVWSQIHITSSLEGDGTHAGLIGVNDSGTMTLENCLFDGTIQSDVTSHCAGFVGWTHGETYINNSLLNAEIYTAEEDCYLFGRNPGSVHLNNTYYTFPYGTENEGALHLETSQMESGEACYLLNGSKVSDNWHQTLPEDLAPTLLADHGIVIPIVEGYQSIQDEESLKSGREALANILRDNTEDLEAYSPLIEKLKADIERLTTSTSIDELMAIYGEIEDDIAAIDTNLDAYATYSEAIESALADVQEMNNPVALLLKDYLTDYIEPDENFTNGSALYIIENYALSTEGIENEILYINDMLQKAMSNDIPAGTDITLLLTNADFSEGDTGWDGTPASNYTSNPNSGQWYGYTEATKTQTLTGLKNGLYEFRMNGLNMVGDDNYCAFYTGVILANGVEIPVMSPMEDALPVEEAVEGVNCHSSDRLVDEMYYIPYSRGGGAIAFAAGRYPNSVMVEVTDGTLTIGARLYGSGRSDDWFMFANAKLYYQGTVEEGSEAIDNVLKGAIDRATTTINYQADASGTRYLIFPNYSQALRDELTTAIQTAQSAADGPSKYAALVKISDLFKEIYTCRMAYRQMAIDVISYYDRIIDYPEFTEIIQTNADNAWDNWLNGSYTAEEALAEGKRLLEEMNGYFVEMPEADLLDVVFNDDGSATDISKTQNEVVAIGTPKVVKSPALDMNVFCHTSGVYGEPASNYYQVLPTEAMLNGLTDGVTFETLARPYWSEEEYNNAWSTVMGMEEGGGIGMIIYNNQWDFEGHIGGDYRDAYAGIAPTQGEWTHLIGVWDYASSTLSIYVNGVLAGWTEASGEYGTPNLVSPWFGIGCDTSNVGESQASFKGDIGLARIYDKPINSSQAALLYKKVKEQFTGLDEHTEGPDVVQSISNTPANPVIYTITGVRVEKPSHGLYIINGKKTMVK